MKIIKQGKNPESRKTCSTCNTVFEYEGSDIKIRTDYLGDKDCYVECPECGHTFDVSWSEYDRRTNKKHQ